MQTLHYFNRGKEVEPVCFTVDSRRHVAHSAQSDVRNWVACRRREVCGEFSAGALSYGLNRVLTRLLPDKPFAARLVELLLPWGNDRRNPKGSLLGDLPEREHSFQFNPRIRIRSD